MFNLNRRDWFIRDEMIYILRSKLLILHLITVRIHLIQTAHEILFIANVLSSRETEVLSTLSLTENSCISLKHLARLGNCSKTESILCTGNQVAAIITTSLEIWTVSLQ